MFYDYKKKKINSRSLIPTIYTTKLVFLKGLKMYLL